MRGLSNSAARSLESCQQRIKKYSLPNNPGGRVASFILKAKNKRYAQGGFSGPGAACVDVRRKTGLDVVYGFILVVYRGGKQIEFPGLNKIVGEGTTKIGSAGSSGRLRLRKAKVEVTITDPPPTERIIIRKQE